MRKLIDAQKQDVKEVVMMKNVKTMKLHAQILILKKSILAQMHAEEQDQVHVVFLTVLVSILIIMITALAHMMMILKT